MAEEFKGVATVRVKNLTKKLIKETFPVYGTISVPAGATRRVPLDVAKTWADPNRYDRAELAKIMAFDIDDTDSITAPVQILDDGETADEDEEDKDLKGPGASVKK